MSNWTLFSNHGHVLVCLSRDSEVRLRDVAADVGITERAVQKIVRDLQDGGMVSVTKNGRRNSYHIHKNQSLRHELEAGCTLKDLIKIVNRDHDPQYPATTEAGVAAESVSPKSSHAEKTRPSSSPMESNKRSNPVPAIESEPKTIETEAPKPKHSDSEERQQGSLF